MMISKIIAMITAAATALSANVAPMSASVDTLPLSGAQTLEAVGDFEYEVLDDGTASITSYKGNDKVVNIPKEIDGYAVTTIGYAAFSYDTFTEVNIPEGVTAIAGYAFSCCYSLTKITLPSTLKAINTSAFYLCQSMTSITLPDGLESLGYTVFDSCSGLTEITIPASVTFIGDSAFRGCNKLSKINVASGNEKYCTVDGVLFNADKTTLISYPAKKSGSTYAIPDSVTSIGGYAFSGCEELKKITLPDGVTAIGEYAFNRCKSLTDISIPEGVTAIEFNTFSECTSLTKIVIPDGVKTIGYSAFYGCTSLAEMTIPGSMTSIVNFALSGCKALNDIYFAFEETDVLPFTVGANGNDPFSAATKHFLITLTDPETGVKTSFYDTCFDTEGTPAFAVPAVADTAAIAEAATKDVDAEQIAAAYDVGFSDADGAVMPVRSVKMYLPVPDEYANSPETALYVYKINDKGTLSDMKAKTKDGYLVFDTDKPGRFFVSTEKIALYIPGDADGNGRVNAGDARLVLKVTAKVGVISDECFAAADMNGNGKIDSGDARAILKLTIK